MFPSDKALEKQENERLRTLYSYILLDTPPEENFDRITRIARTALEAPIALMTLIDRDRQWFKSKQGTDVKESARSASFCTYTIQNDEPMVVHDLRKDIRFADNPFVKSEPHLRFYCGVPLKMRDGHSIGSLCILDRKPRKMNDSEMAMIIDLARMTINEIELRNLTKMDFLTGLHTCRAFYEIGETEIKKMQRNSGNLSVVAFDIDHFKKINEKYGQLGGDAVLRTIAETCKPHVRPEDIFGRVGGEEFAVLMPHTTIEDAKKLADKLMAAIDKMHAPVADRLVKTTCSFGVTSYFPGDKEFAFLLNRGFAALLRAKRGGRDKCVIIDPVAEPPILGGSPEAIASA